MRLAPVGEGHEPTPVNWAIAVTAALLVTACEREARIDVVQVSGVVTVTATRDGGPACLSDLYVYRTAGANKPIWHIAAAMDAPCTHVVILGRVPPHFSPDSDAPSVALEPGTAYEIEVSGSGFIGTTRFEAEGN